MTLKEFLSQNQNQDQDQNPQNENIISDSEANEPEGVEVQVEAQTVKGSSFSDLLKRASDGLKESLSDDSGPAPRRGRPAKTNRDDFSVLVVSLVTLLVSFAKFPEEVKPNKDEIGAFSNNASDIMLRHLPINGKLSADALNVIGMFTALATWRVRVGPALETMKQGQPAAQIRPGPVSVDLTKNNGRVLTPIEEVSPMDADFLSGAARRMSGAE